MVKFGVNLSLKEDYSKTLEHAVEAESLGLEYIFISDHLRLRNPYIALTTLCLHTRKARIGTGVTNPYLIHPAVTAQLWASLDELAPRRIIGGIGAGDRNTLRLVGVRRSRPLHRVRETVEMIRSMLSTNPPTGGRQVSLGVRLHIPPPNPIPIFIGAQGPRMIRLAAEIGDGVLINTPHPPYYREVIRTTCGEAARRRGFKIFTLTPFSISRDEEEARLAVRRTVAVVVAGCSDQVLAMHGIPVEAREALEPPVAKGDLEEASRRVTQDMLDAFSIYGTPSMCLERVEALVEAGIDAFIAAFPIGVDVHRSLQLYSREVVHPLTL